MSTKFSMTRDINGFNGFGLKFADDRHATTLVTGAEQTLTVPTSFSKWIAIFGIEPGADAWISLNTTAALPGATFAASNAELNPVAREVAAGDVLHFITPNADCRISVLFYGLKEDGLR